MPPDARPTHGVAHPEFAVDIWHGTHDANVLIVGTKVIDADQAPALRDRRLATPFTGGHTERIAQITRLAEPGGICGGRKQSIAAAARPRQPPGVCTRPQPRGRRRGPGALCGCPRRRR